MKIPAEPWAYLVKTISILTFFASMLDGHLGSIKAGQHCIRPNSIDYWPKRLAPYRLGPKAREFRKRKIYGLLAMDIIEPIKTKASSTFQFFPKNDGKLPFSVIYQSLKDLTIWDSRLILCLKDCIDYLGEATVFFTTDACSRYRHVEIAQDGRYKAPFTSHQRLFRFTQIFSELRNNSETI